MVKSKLSYNQNLQQKSVPASITAYLWRKILYLEFFSSLILKGEKKFEDFSQLTPAGKRLTFVLISLALGGKPKDTLKWLKDHDIISESHYNEKFVYEVIRHWKISGEVFLKPHKSNF